MGVNMSLTVLPLLLNMRQSYFNNGIIHSLLAAYLRKLVTL